MSLCELIYEDPGSDGMRLPAQQDPSLSPFIPWRPFAGGGARKCIGDQFAITEAAVALVMVLRRFRFRLQDPQSVRVLLASPD